MFHKATPVLSAKTEKSLSDLDNVSRKYFWANLTPYGDGLKLYSSEKCVVFCVYVFLVFVLQGISALLHFEWFEVFEHCQQESNLSYSSIRLQPLTTHMLLLYILCAGSAALFLGILSHCMKLLVTQCLSGWFSGSMDNLSLSIKIYVYLSAKSFTSIGVKTDLLISANLYRFCISNFYSFFVMCCRVSWLSISFWVHDNIVVSYPVL